MLFVWWWCLLRRVMYECFFFLYDVTVLLPFISKKKGPHEYMLMIHMFQNTLHLISFMMHNKL